MPHSHHSHSGQFCAHAQGSLEDVVQAAIAKGFETYGLSEHVPRAHDADLYPEEVAAALTPTALADRFDAFVAEAHRLRDAYAGRIALLVGLETEVIRDDDLGALETLLARHGRMVEYVVGSVHHVGGVPIDFDRPTYERALAAYASAPSSPSTPSTPDEHATMSAYLCAYFDAQHALLSRIKPEIVGHVDLCRLYTPDLRLQDYPAAWAKLERNVALAVSYGALFEANAAALRKGWPGAYPGADVVALILACGGRFALSDDAHGPAAVGLNYSRMHEYLIGVGVRELWYLQRAHRPNAAGRYVEAVRLETDWAMHSFWDGLEAGSQG
jgi:histidinol-phosphatase (PHP family)